MLRAALVGAGAIARQHLACLNELPGVRVVAVCDLSPAAAECAAERFAIPGVYTDLQSMLDESSPDIVHVTTPPTSHAALAAMALRAGRHVILEKPATTRLDELVPLLAEADNRSLHLIENYNYLFNRQTRAIVREIEEGRFGNVIHVDVFLCLDILGEGSPFADPNAPHPTARLRGGAIEDFLSHLASLAYRFLGPHDRVETIWSKRGRGLVTFDEFRAFVETPRGTAHLAFSSHAQPDGFWLRVHGERMSAVANLFETRLTFDRVLGGPKPLRPLRNGLRESREVRRAAYGGLWRKLSGGPGSYEGLWEFLKQTYSALSGGGPWPVGHADVLAVNQLVEAMRPASLPAEASA